MQTLKEITLSDKNHLFEAQISSYDHTENEYLVLASATKDPFRYGYFRSIALGIMISPHAQSKIAFLNDSTIKKKKVGVTCESCTIIDCKERIAQPKKLERKARFAKTEEVVRLLATAREIRSNIVTNYFTS